MPKRRGKSGRKHDGPTLPGVLFRQLDGFDDGGTDGVPTKKCFHLLGLDVLLDINGKPWLLEANYRPSLLIDEVHPLQAGLSRAEVNKIMSAARKLPRGDGYSRPCTCSAHPSLHEHKLSVVDAAVKGPAVAGALQIAHRAQRGGNAADWAEGTVYLLV